MMNKDEFLTPHDYEMALHSQSACNLSGIVFGFAEVMQKICNEANRDGHGTEWKNKHPICRLYAEQIAHLSGAGASMDTNSYFEASKICRERSR